MVAEQPNAQSLAENSNLQVDIITASVCIAVTFLSLSICESLSPCFTKSWPNQPARRRGDSMTQHQTHQLKCFVACFFIPYIQARLKAPPGPQGPRPPASETQTRIKYLFHRVTGFSRSPIRSRVGFQHVTSGTVKVFFMFLVNLVAPAPAMPGSGFYVSYN